MTIYFFGDSIGQGVICGEDGRYHICADDWTAAFRDADCTIENYASLGFTVDKGLNKLEAKTPAPGGLCLIEFGGNDCDMNWKEVAADPDADHRAKLEPDAFSEKLSRFVSRCRDMGLRPVLLTPVPVLAERYFARITRDADPDAVLRYLRDKGRISRQQESYANIVRYTARNTGCDLIDVRQTFLRQADLPSLYCSDGIHLNERGQALYGRVLFEAVMKRPAGA